MILKRIAFAMIAGAFFLASCEKDYREDATATHIISGSTLNGANVVPANASAATGTVTGSYDSKTKVFTYKVTWSGLSAAVTGIHIHGPASAGTVSPTPTQSAAGFSTATSGSYSGTLLADGNIVRQSDLLAGQYYIDIHTSQSPYSTTGEIRGQLTFDN